MAGSRTDTRTRLVEAATKLVHANGFNQTSLADIAKDAKVPLGNVYYYFKSKAEIGRALIERRENHYKVLRQKWEANADPRARVEAFVQMIIDSSQVVARSGCPIGSLCTELRKGGGPLARQSTRLFADLLSWLEAQFRALGKGDESRGLALHVLSVVQGAILLTHSFDNPDYLVDEGNRLKEWVRTLSTAPESAIVSAKRARR